MSEIDFCGECVGTGVVLGWIDDDGTDVIEGCDWCGGSGHWDADAETPVSGPCEQPGCAECAPEPNPANAIPFATPAMFHPRKEAPSD